MTHPSDSVLSDEEIEGRTEALVKDGSTQERVERFAQDLVATCRGEVAEQALTRLVHVLEPDRVCRLLTDNMVKTLNLTSRPDYCGSGSLLAVELERRGFSVDSVAGWQVALPEPHGTELESMLKPVQGEDAGIRLCRLGLLGVWILDMRGHPFRTSAF